MNGWRTVCVWVVCGCVWVCSLAGCLDATPILVACTVVSKEPTAVGTAKHL